MDAITGMFMKQKMGEITENVPGLGNKQDDKPPPTSSAIRKDMAAKRAERDAEYEKKKAERASKKSSIAEKWAKNKSANR